MKEVTLIQCTDSKRDEKALAKDLYDGSPLFRDMKAYARALRQPWFILSAKHGLVSPHTKLEPYDEFGLSEEQAKETAQELADMNVGTVEIIAGKEYTTPLVPELEKAGIDVINNFAGQRYGERQENLKRQTNELVHKQL